MVFVLLCLVWSSTWLAIKVGLRFLPPFIFSGLSFAAATIPLLVLAKFLHTRFPKDWSSWGVMIFLGLTMMGGAFGLQYWGEQYVSSGLAAILFGTAPLFAVIFAHILIEEEKIHRWKLIGIVFSFVGMLVIFRQELSSVFNWNTQSSVFGTLAEVASAAATALAIVVYKRFYAEIDRVVNLLVQSIVGFAFLLILGLVWEKWSTTYFTPSATMAIVYLGLVSTLPFIGYYWLLEKSSVISVSMITFITPILALVFGWMLLGEQLNGGIILGGALILTGVYLTSKQNVHSEPATKN